jgi:hypothetical protein
MCSVESILRCTICIVEPYVCYNEHGVEMIVCENRKPRCSTHSLQIQKSVFMILGDIAMQSRRGHFRVCWIVASFQMDKICSMYAM